jgi:hypothetical protein
MFYYILDINYNVVIKIEKIVFLDKEYGIKSLECVCTKKNIL